MESGPNHPKTLDKSQPAATETAQTPAETTSQLSPRQIFWRFLQFGFLAWGGPVAQIAMIRRDLVDREHWISSTRFNRLLAIYQVLPGPEAHELCVHLGMLRGRRLGGLLAGLAFMLPGFILMFALSWLYFQIDISQSALGAIFLGVQPAVIALIVRAVHRIGEHVVIDAWLWALAIASAVAAAAGTTFWITLPTAGLLYMLVRRSQYVPAGIVAVVAIVAGVFLTHSSETGLFAAEATRAASAAPSASAPSLVALFLAGLKAGLLTFGGAYTVIPFLRDDAVGSGWMTDAQFLDGLALSGILPAPLIIFSTFVGYFGGGPLGAVAMTIGIFLPAFSFSLLLYERLESVVENKTFHTFLEGVSAGVVGLIAATTVELALAVIGRLPTVLPGTLIFAVGLGVLYLWKARANVVFVIFGAGLAGWLLF